MSKTISFVEYLQERMPGVKGEADRVAKWRDCVAAMPGASVDKVNQIIEEQRRYGFNELAAFYWANWFDRWQKSLADAADAAARAAHRAAGAKGNASQKRKKDGTKDKQDGTKDKRTGGRRSKEAKVTLRALNEAIQAGGLDTISRP